MNLVQFATNVVQYGVLEGALSHGMRIIQGFIITLYATLTVGNVVIYCLTDKEVAKLRQILIDILDLENQVEEVMRAIHDAEDWLALNDPI